MSVTHSQLKVGTRVRVLSFEATVVTPQYDGNHRLTDRQALVEIRDDNSAYHRVFVNQMELVDPPIPYEDGKKYRDADGDQCTFTSDGYFGEKGWLFKGSVRSYSWAARPLQEVLSEPTYGPEITE